MNTPVNCTELKLSANLNLAVNYIANCQMPDGSIPWFDDGKLDPWDHTEALIGLCIGQKYSEARAALLWLADNQNDNGSWFANYFISDDVKETKKIETNFVAYPATGLLYFYLCSKDTAFTRDMFGVIEKGINFVLSLQTADGDIQWAISEVENLPKDALVTACSSILRSLQAAIQLAELLSNSKPEWIKAYHRLAEALLNKPWRFDRSWESKARFSMDWFYPVLAGIFSPSEAAIRLEKRWQEFVQPELGCRCVSDEPWVTIAESCELTLALIAAGKKEEALALFNKLLQWQDSDGGYWTGYSFRDKVIWPKEKPTWTAAAVLLAADALYSITPAASFFVTPSYLLK